MVVVITGASGFLGSTLLHVLNRLGIHSIGVSRNPGRDLIVVDSYENAPSADVLIHLAEVSDRRLANSLGSQYLESTLSSLYSLLSKGYSRIIYASSAVVYGDSSAKLRRVDDQVFSSDTYSSLKLSSEKAVLDHNGVVARLANVYGPRMTNQNVFTDILLQLDTDGPIILRDIFPIRDFIWIDDVASAIVSMIAAKCSGIYNVGTGIGYSTLHVARTIASAAGQPCREIISQTAKPNVSSLVLDIAETSSVFGWHPLVSLPAGVRELLSSQNSSPRHEDA